MKQRITFALIMGMITTSIISFVLIAVNVGFIEKFFLIWVRSWSISYVLAVTAMLLIGPRVQQLVTTLLSKELVPVEEEAEEE